MTTKRQIMERLDRQGEWIGTIERRFDADARFAKDRFDGIEIRVEENTQKLKELIGIMGSLPYTSFSAWIKEIENKVDALAENLGVEFEQCRNIRVTPKSEE